MNPHYASEEIHSVTGNLQSSGDEITGTKVFILISFPA